jgi:hypothetical protein
LLRESRKRVSSPALSASAQSDRLDGPEGVLADVVGEAVEHVGLGLDGEDAGVGARKRGDEERIGADAGAHVDEDHILAHAAAQTGQFLGVEELGREQNLLFAEVVVGVEPHAEAQRLHVRPACP